MAANTVFPSQHPSEISIEFRLHLFQPQNRPTSYPLRIGWVWVQNLDKTGKEQGDVVVFEKREDYVPLLLRLRQNNVCTHALFSTDLRLV